MPDCKPLHYELFTFPENPYSHGKYFGKTPLREQMETVIRNASEKGEKLFAHAVYADGTRIFL